jgi:hypothetical protein
MPISALTDCRLPNLAHSVVGEFRSSKQYALSQFLQSAKLDPMFPGNFTYLGHYYRFIESDLVKAKRCYQKALSLSDSLDSDAGIALR